MARALPRGHQTALAVVVFGFLAAGARAEEEPKDEIDKTDFGVSVMLMGALSFTMGIFFMTNHSDQDIRLYAWKVISATISIFSAVLLFSGTQRAMKALLGIGEQNFPFDVAFGLLWICVLQVALALIASKVNRNKEQAKKEKGAASGAPGREQRMDSDASGAPSSAASFDVAAPGAAGEEQGKKEGGALLESFAVEDLETFARLLGHITGFAAIAAWAGLQHHLILTFGRGHLLRMWGIGFAAVLVSGLCMWGVLQLTDLLRKAWADLKEEEDDEKALEEWHEKTTETENDVIGLTMSWQLVQFIRFVISGVLPNPEGEEPEDMIHSVLEVSFLLGAAGLFAYGVGSTTSKAFEYPRLRAIRKITWAMSFAWCVYNGFSWWLTSEILVGEHDATVAVVLALITTFIAFGLIYAMDKVADSNASDQSFRLTVRAIIDALGILIGFTWEKSFDVALTAISKKVTVSPSVTSFVFAILLTALVVPAWRWYILPKELALEEVVQISGRTADTMSAEERKAKKKARKAEAAEKKKKDTRILRWTQVKAMGAAQADITHGVSELNGRILASSEALVSLAAREALGGLKDRRSRGGAAPAADVEHQLRDLMSLSQEGAAPAAGGEQELRELMDKWEEVAGELAERTLRALLLEEQVEELGEYIEALE